MLLHYNCNDAKEHKICEAKFLISSVWIVLILSLKEFDCGIRKTYHRDYIYITYW